MHKIDFASKRKTVDIEVEELGETLTLRALSVRQLNSLDVKEPDYAPKMLAMAIIDKESGQRIYTSDEDLVNLAEMSMSCLKQLTDAVAILNGLGKDVVAEVTKKYIASLDTGSDSN